MSNASPAAPAFPVRMVPIAQITQDPGLQTRAQMSQPTVVLYAQMRREGITFAPVVVFQEPPPKEQEGAEQAEGPMWLADGWHRVASVKHDDGWEIEAEVRPGGRAEALRYAAGANARHGLPLTNADKHRCVKLLLDDPSTQELSGAEIARMVGCVTPQFVNGLIRERKEQAALRADPLRPRRVEARRALERLKAEGVEDLAGVAVVQVLEQLGAMQEEALVAVERALKKAASDERARREDLAFRLDNLRRNDGQLERANDTPIAPRSDLAHSTRLRDLGLLTMQITAAEFVVADRLKATQAPKTTAPETVSEPDVIRCPELHPTTGARCDSPAGHQRQHGYSVGGARLQWKSAHEEDTSDPPSDQERTAPLKPAKTVPQIDLRERVPAGAVARQVDGSFLVSWPISLVDELWGPVQEVQAKARKGLLTRDDCAQIVRDVNRLLGIASTAGRTLPELAACADWTSKDAAAWGEARTAVSLDIGPRGVLRLHVRRTSHTLLHQNKAQLTIPVGVTQ